MDCKEVKRNFRQMETELFQQMPEISWHLANCDECRSLTGQVVGTLNFRPIVPLVLPGFEVRLAKRLLNEKSEQRVLLAGRIWGGLAIAASIALGVVLGSQTYNNIMTGNNAETILSANYQEMLPLTGHQLTDLLNEPEE